MATLAPSAKLANLKRSLDVYLDAQFPAASYTVDWGPPAPFSDLGLKEWFQPRLLEPARPSSEAYGPVSSTQRGEGWTVLVSINLFIRPAMQTVGHRLQQLRDLVLAAFAESTAITVKDYEGNSATVGALVVDRLEADRLVPDPQRPELQQWQVLVAMRWIASWTP